MSTIYCTATTRGRYAPRESIFDNLGASCEKNAFGRPKTAQPTHNARDVLPVARHLGCTVPANTLARA
jgi:hypothetical protein